MLIINADDWGRSKSATDCAVACHERGRISSASAMVFMEDSARGAELAKACGLNIGLHLNFSEDLTGAQGNLGMEIKSPFSGPRLPSRLC